MVAKAPGTLHLADGVTDMAEALGLPGISHAHDPGEGTETLQLARSVEDVDSVWCLGPRRRVDECGHALDPAPRWPRDDREPGIGGHRQRQRPVPQRIDVVYQPPRREASVRLEGATVVGGAGS